MAQNFCNRAETNSEPVLGTKNCLCSNKKYRACSTEYSQEYHQLVKLLVNYFTQNSANLTAKKVRREDMKVLALTTKNEK